ncbi:MAG: hypothetical protein ACJAS1_005271 [Oleiphilaceae bacterium]|jgi:hypothetical protein
MIKILNTISVLVWLVLFVCLLVWGYTLTAVSVILASACCLAARLIISGDGLFEIFVSQ